MFRFIKVNCTHYNTIYHNWFLVYDVETRLRFSDVERMQRNLIKDVMPKFNEISETTPVFELNAEISRSKLRFVANTYMVDIYNKTLERDPELKILVRPNGTWMILTENHVITAETYRQDANFPAEQHSDILVCENDPEPEKWWIDHLNQKYQKNITTLFNFYSREQREIDEYVLNSEIITFTTTMSSEIWFEKLINSLEKCTDKELYWHCKDHSVWPEIIQKYETTLSKHRLEIYGK